MFWGGRKGNRSPQNGGLGEKKMTVWEMKPIDRSGAKPEIRKGEQSRTSWEENPSWKKQRGKTGKVWGKPDVKKEEKRKRKRIQSRLELKKEGGYINKGTTRIATDEGKDNARVGRGGGNGSRGGPRGTEAKKRPRKGRINRRKGEKWARGGTVSRKEGCCPTTMKKR